MTQNDTTRLLARRRDKAIAIVLGVKERECDPFLPEEESRTLRKVVLDQFNDFFNLAEELIEGNVVLNREYMDKLDALLEELSDG